MRGKINTIFVALIFSTSIFAKTVSLEEILEYATQHSKALALKQTDALIELKNINSAKSAYYPSLNLLYNAEYNEALDGTPLGVESIGGMTISNETRYQSSMALQLNYDLYHFGVTDTYVNIASLEYKIKKIEWCFAQKQLYQAILEYYTKALKSEAEIEYKTKMLEIRKKLYSMKERLHAAGKYSKIDLGDEAIYIMTIERDIENNIMEYKENSIRVSQLSTMEMDDNIKLLPLHAEKENTISDNYPDTIQGQILYKKITKKREEISLNMRQQLPSLGLYSNYYLYGTHPKEYDYTVRHLNEKSWNIGLALRVNIFEGFKHSTAQERLQLELQRLEQEFDESKHNYEYDTKSKNTKIMELSLLKKHEQSLLEENYKKREMLHRLREEQNIDLLTQLTSEYELLKHALSLHTREIDASFEKISLNILNRGVDKCTQH